MLLHKQVPISHYKFQKDITLAWIGGGTHWKKNTDDRERVDHRRSFENAREILTTSTTRPSRKRKTSTTQVTESTRRSLCSSETKEEVKREKSPRVTDKSLAANGIFRVRLNRGEHWPVQDLMKKEPRCQLHFWATGEKHRAQLMRCNECDVTLCIHCFKLFHTSENLVKHKERIADQLRLCMTKTCFPVKKKA